MEATQSNVESQIIVAKQAVSLLALQAEILRGKSALDALAGEWEALSQDCRTRCVFHSHAWARHIAHLDGRPAVAGDISQRNGRDRAGSEADGSLADATADADGIVVATCRRGGRLVGLWPLEIDRRRGLSLFISIGAPFNQFSEPLIARTETAWPVLREMAAALRRSRLADGMLLRKIRARGDLTVLKQGGAGSIDSGDSAPFVSFDPAKPFDDYLATVNAKSRKNLRNAENRLRRQGDLVHEVHGAAAIGGLLEATFDRRRSWLDAQGLSSEAFRNPGFRRFVTSLADTTGSQLGILGFALRLSGRPIALQWGFVHAGTYSAYLSARDPELESFSVGRLHLKYVLEACHQRGIGRVDLMVPTVPYKMTWASGVEPVLDLIWPWTPRGFLALGVVEQNLRPRAKRIAAGLPVTVRRRIMALATRRGA